MARTALQKVYADFRQGFVTVANPLAYPEGSLKDIVNFDIKDNGTLKLRPGLQKQEGLVDLGLTLSEVNDRAVSLHKWENVNNEGDKKIAVVQVGSTLYFFDMLSEGIDVANPLGNINIGLTSAGRKIEISTAFGEGKLFVCHPELTPFTVSLSEGSFVTKDITLEIRDLNLWEGIDDQETGLTESKYLYSQHEYNLRNGGWPKRTRVSESSDPDDSTIANQDPVNYTKTKLGIHPPIYIPFYVGKNGGGDRVTKQQAFNPWRLDGVTRASFGNSPIPMGRFIVEAEEWTRQGVAGLIFDDFLGGDIPGGVLEKTYKWTSKPSSVAFYAGRVWYTGAKGYSETTVGFGGSKIPDELDVSGTLYFSQQIDDNDKRIGRCYQENDPTAEDINQLLATDGGTLSIKGVGEIFDMKVFATYLLVFSSQGVWAVSGVDGNSFKADGFSVNKISSVGPVSKKTIGATGNNIYYVANDAIYVVSQDEVSGLPTTQDITSARVKDFYNNIPFSQKERSKLVFDISTRTFYFLYSDKDSIEEGTENLVFNKALVFNQDLGAYYKYEMPLTNNYIFDGIYYNKQQEITLERPITLDGVAVELDGETVSLLNTYSTGSLNNTQFLTITDDGAGNAGITFSSFTNITTFKDFDEGYQGYVEFGFDTAGDIMRDSIQAPVIISHMERTEDGFEVNPEDPDQQELILSNRSSCLMSYGWDWSTGYRNPQQLYRFKRNYTPSGTDDPFNYGVDVITTRNRIRGKGHSLGIRLETEAGKDCRLLGLGIMYTAAQKV